MIPSTNNKLLVSEDWKKVYQSFRNAEFQSYDFETLRRTMIQYLQQNFSEDFNDFIDSSEYIALVDLIAYLGQNLSFRIDLNARENFLETAQRRDSILRLAQLISYVPTRNVPASGFLKITAIATTDSVTDSNGTNLANSTIVWNDPTSTNWYEQFVTIMNSSMGGSFTFGKPYDRKTIDGILTEQYRINSTNADVPIYSFLKTVNGTAMNFEIVPATMSGATTVYEEPPKPANSFSLIYKNDNQGSSSSNTGFFVHFKQGKLAVSNFTITTPVANEIIGVNVNNINDTDVWLWNIDSNGTYSTLWTKVPAVTGNNIIYNSLSNSERNIFSVTSRDQDQIDLNFADGSFGNLPQGQFNLFYRQSNGLTYTIKPEQMSGIVVEIPYINKGGQSHTLTLTMGLQYTVSNSAGPETNASIQNKAPQVYYTQNRMVTAEDYNVAPLTLGSNILKVKSVARVNSGLSKYFELSDVSGKYSKTNIFATDGILYKNNQEKNFEFSFSTGNRNEIFSAIKFYLEPVVANPALRSFYFDQYERPSLEDLKLYWTQDSKSSTQCSGHFVDNDIDGPTSVGTFISNNLKYATQGSLIKFVAPGSLSPTDSRYNASKNYFKPNGTLVSAKGANTLDYIWVKVVQVVGDGSNTGQGALDNGTGPVIFSNIIDSGAVPVEIIPKFVDVFTYAFETELVNLCLNQRNFGLSFNQVTRKWTIILDTNIDLISPFSLTFQGNKDNANRDASWMIAFTWTGKSYKVRYRLTDYIFESEKETAFFIDPNTVNYDYNTNSVVKDQINVLSINPSNIDVSLGLGKDYQWQIDGAIVETDGYVEPKKVKISFYDYNSSGQISDPDTFMNIVEPTSTNELNFQDKFVYFKKSTDGQRYTLVDKELFRAFPTPDDADANLSNLSSPVNDGDLFYFYDPAYNIVKSYSAALAGTSDHWVYQSDYYAYSGRDSLKFQYVHNSGEDRRIDPSKSNIVDVYLLTSDYDLAFRNWLSSGTGTEPLAPTSSSLEQNYSAKLEPIKTISDEIIFQPVKYKVLFGNKASGNLQGVFKAVRNPARPTSDNDLRSRILMAIEDFFSLQNWDFGQSFYFSELSTYVMNVMTPDITNFIIVPNASNSFGSLYEIACQSNELFINGASANDIEIIDAITSSQLKSSGTVTTSGS
jgi:hypothetical protein